MQNEDDRLRPTPAERFEGTEHVYDLAGAIEQLRREPRTAHGGHRQVTLFKHATSTLSVFYFDPAGGLPEHKANGFVTIHVLSGRMSVKTPEHDHDLTAGKLVVLAPNVRHSLSAVEACEMLLIVTRA
ncbi:MAG: cupin domain-containing protein [Burkholderiales bacterium]|nr:cupin domain-containing protein [Phycisphaerae bacterium]